MTESERDELMLDGFLMGLRVMYHAHGIRGPASEAEKPWDVLREIAEGRLTLALDPAEQALKYPSMPRALKDHLARHTNEFIARDREKASLILQAFIDHDRGFRKPALP